MPTSRHLSNRHFWQFFLVFKLMTQLPPFRQMYCFVLWFWIDLLKNARQLKKIMQKYKSQNQFYSKIQTSFNAKNHHHNQRHLGAPSIDFSWHIWIFGLPDSLGIFFIKWKIFLNLFQKNLYFTKKYLAQILPYQNGCQ